MATTYTTNASIPKPGIGEGAWGATLNAALDAIDSVLPISVASFATGGTGTIGSPWTGWDTALALSGTHFYRIGYYTNADATTFHVTGFAIGHGEWFESVDGATGMVLRLVKSTGAGGNVVVGAGDGASGTVWLGSDDLNDGDSSNGDVIIGYGKHYRAGNLDNDFTRKLVGLATVGTQEDCVKLGDNALPVCVGDPATVANTPGGSLVFANDRGIRAANGAGDDAVSVAKIDSTDRVQLGEQGTNTSKYPAIPIMATGLLPAAGSAMDGCVLIEDGGAGDRNLIVYSGGERFRIDGGVAF